MKLKFLFLLLLVLAPEVTFAYYVWHPCCSRFCLPGWWASAEYMYLWRKKRFFPALVTTNPTLDPNFSNPGTTILFGDERLGGTPRSGVRADGGFWITRCLGVGTGFFAVGSDKITFNIQGDPNFGLPILGRPFFDTVTQTQEAYSVSRPLIAHNGSIEIDSFNSMWGYDIYARRRLANRCCFKFDLLGGFLYNRLIDTLNITTQRTRDIIIIGRVVEEVNDQFNCNNKFYGGLLGFSTEWRNRRLALSCSGKVGIGKMAKEVNVIGSSTFSFLGSGVVTTIPVGLLAQPSNIGLHRFTKFEVVPQGNANVDLRVWGPLWFKAGYTITYWPGVALAGEQVNLNINRTQFPGPTIGAPEPILHQKNKDFWMHGLTAGFYIFF